MRNNEGERSNFDGTFNFSKDTNNPSDSNWAFANAALGVFSTYDEANARYGANERQTEVEWFAQDTWKATRRLTLDLGLRWTWANSMYPQKKNEQSVLALGHLRSSQSADHVPAGDLQRREMAQNPITGALLPRAMWRGSSPIPGTRGMGG